MNHFFYSPLYISILTMTAQAQSSTPEELAPMVVTGKSESLLGTAGTASKGQASNLELNERPYLRRGELLEAIPGVIITQHSGDGKANQYFVRGFNLDHGTDFSISMDGQPVNFVTHAHGQGYADLNPIIPELVEQLDYWKGPFYGQLGDLSTAGAAKFRFFNMLPQGIATFGYGEDNYFRGLIADTIDLTAPADVSQDDANNSSLTPSNDDRSGFTYALEYNYYDGPWELPSNSQRINGFLKYYKQSGQDQFSITAMGYDGEWDSTDQIPKRAVDNIGRFGNLDETLGGESSRYSLMAAWDRENTNGRTHADFYVGYYDLDLFSNFTYFLTDPVNGDEFEQKDERYFAGGEIRREWDFGNSSTFTVGLQTRHDLISGVGLYNTLDRERLSTVREDDVYEANVGIYAVADYHVNEWFRMQPGLRADGFYFDVESNDPVNSRNKTDGIVSPKLNLIFGPWSETEIYANAGLGFHSNDARGVTLAVDAADPIVRTYGYELGVRTEVLPNVVSTVALFYLHSDSELIYIGDAGTSEPGPATERYGIEWSTYWRPTYWLTIDNEITLSEGKSLGVGSDNEIPGAVPITLNAGVTFGRDEGFFGSLRGRFFSPRPLIEDGSVESRQSFQVNSRVGYRKNDWEVAVDVLNLLGRDDNDIEYFYASRLPGEGVDGVEDIHFHPTEPRTFRISLTHRF
ncbi:MAG: TonB-dependent receptor plug domain-containing protein [Armatimonadetes bacterium]|nr:TonB-dependent receptor plug domain-containing protein [Akkermansiaceae bacterium]